MLYDWILTNKELLKVVYALAICFICAAIVLKTDRLFKLSDYQGLRYLRNTFFFYALAFMSRFILGKLENPLPHYGQFYSHVMNIFFELFIIMAGFFLLYSLIWKYIEKEKNYNSLFNFRIGAFAVVAVIIVILDALSGNNVVLYASQIFLFSIMSVISLKNYLKSEIKHSFTKYYFLTILMGLFSWILNAFAYFFTKTGIVQIYIYIINMVFFLLFLYGTLRMTKK